MNDAQLLRSYVDGAWRDGVRVVPDIDPAHPKEAVASSSLADTSLVADAVAGAYAAYAKWRATPAPSRGEILRKAADLVDQRANDIARDLTREEGKTFSEALGETQRAASTIRYYAAQTVEPDGDLYPSHKTGVLLYTRREPLGVVTVITPWNFPIMIPAWKIAPALAFGNTVVWKPAELTPLTATHLMKAFIDAGVPAGVLQLVLGSGSQVGDALVTHPRVGAVSFTGSNTVGRALQAKAVGARKAVQLELGGKNPAIVLADADLDMAAEGVARGAFLSAGQKCTATSRVIVAREVMKPFLERLVSRAEAWKLGDPLEKDTIVSPLVSADQRQRVLAFIEGAQGEGARAVAGGGVLRGNDGFFVRPTVLVDVKPEHAIAREEVFGPVASLLPAASFDEALALANDTPFGLSASLYTRDLATAHHFADQAQAGIVLVNLETSAAEYHVPFGGIKDSGAGPHERGKAAREFLTQEKTVYINAS